MNAQQQDSPSITVVRSLPVYKFPIFEKQKTSEKGEGHAIAAIPGVERSGVAIDLGTPNLGTAWQVNSLSVYYEHLKAQYFNLAVATEDLSLYFTTYLYMGASEIYREASEKIKFSGTASRTEGLGPLFESSLVGLQNLPQALVVPGGQQLIVELAAFEQGGGTLATHIVGELTIGKVTMNYTRVAG